MTLPQVTPVMEPLPSHLDSHQPLMAKCHHGNNASSHKAKITNTYFSPRYFYPGQCTMYTRTILWNFIFVLLLYQTEALNTTYPPLFNAALDATVTLDPANGTCGIDGEATYCESFSSHTSVEACRTSQCSLQCSTPDRNRLTYPIINFSKVKWESREADGCVEMQQGTVGYKPGTAYYFKGDTTQGACYLDLISDWVVSLTLFQVWSATLTAWIKPLNSQTGTILALANEKKELALRFYLNGDVQLGVDTGRQVVTRSDWALPKNQWTFIGVTVEDGSVSVYFNGSLIGDAVYGVLTYKPNLAKTGRIGQSFTGSDFFIGVIQNLTLYVHSLSNREIVEVYTGKLPELRVMSQCRCPAGYASINSRDQSLCEANPGVGRPVYNQYRISQKAFPIEQVNDGRNESRWLSNIGQDKSTITLTLNQTYEIYRVIVLLYSPPPNYVRLEKRIENSPWITWHHFAVDCQQRGLPINYTDPDDVTCTPIATNVRDDNYPFTEAPLTFDLQGRVNISNALGDFTKVTSLRVYLEGYLNIISDRGHRYHAINEILVQSRCECNGHGIACDRGQQPYQCVCSPQSYTRGRKCEICIDDAFMIPGRSVNHPLYCQACDCQTNGTINGSPLCEKMGGQCDCKKNVQNRRCDKCKDGFFNISNTNQDGCQTCDCNVAGVIQGSLSCNDITGQCNCKDQVTGRTCDVCKDGYYDLQMADRLGCKPCDCDEAGTKAASQMCDKNTGQCMCKAYTDGQQCNICKDAYYGLNKNYVDGCSPCGCDMRGSVNSSCDALSGQCYCKLNVIGRICETCAPGFYAIDENDFQQNGCIHQCDCNEFGTQDGNINKCAVIGGQCLCKDNVIGRPCDSCKLSTYGFGSSQDKGCLPCICDRRGIISSMTACNMTTGQCNCKENVQGLRCDQCVLGTFRLSEENPTGCEKCVCYKYGVVTNKPCNNETGACECKPGAGDPARSNYKCYPYLNTIVDVPKGVQPLRGPEIGGTRVTLSGGFLGAASMGLANVTIANLTCHIFTELSNDTTVVCFTESLRRFNMSWLVNQTTKGQLNLALNNVTDTSFDYTYLEDPTITSVRPLTSMQSGGLKMTVTGQKLDAVSEPRLLVHMVYYGNMTTFESRCKATPTRLICPTPNIKIPDQYDDNDNNRGQVTSQPSRKKRDAQVEDSLNTKDVQFYFGFAFDEADLYNNITQDVPDIGQLIIYKDPEFDEFKERDQIKVYQPYWPFSHKNLVLHGQRLNLAASKEDYMIEIGKSYCDEIQLTTNRLTCIPPKRQPDALSQLQRKGAPHVQANVGNIKLVIGFLDYEHNFWENLRFRYGVIGGLIGLLLLLLLIILCVCCCKRRKKRQDAMKKHPHLYMRTVKPNANNYISAYNTMNSNVSTDTYLVAATDLLMLLPEELRQKVTSCLIDPSRMEVGKVIGQGHYGRVHLGKLADKNNEKTIDVAVKTLREYHVSPQNVIDFLEEATIMKDFNHEHVSSMYGVVIDDNNKAYVLLPYMSNGDLKAYVADDNNMLRVGELIDFGLQVADGMCYLSERKFIHRDLAARNCMVDSSGVVKIADFGLSCDLFESDYYRSGEEKRPLPVKWMAIESLEYKIYSTKSDVWAFGVLLWELLTRGCTPYPDIDSYDIKNYLISGNRMDKPDFAPQDIYQLMTECWELSPENRPTFREIAVRLTRFLEENNTNTAHRRHNARYVRPRSLHDQQVTMTLDLLP